MQPFRNWRLLPQTPKEFDFPDVPQAPAFHYAGPFHDDYGRAIVAFPWERLTGEPLIYGSMCTLVNGFKLLPIERTNCRPRIAAAAFRMMRKTSVKPRYRDAARRFQRTIAQTHGLDRAADVLERAFQLVDEPVSHDGAAFDLPLQS
jgi:UDP:flavonoid glycosyltransferase YjiC (YdhE family)